MIDRQTNSKECYTEIQADRHRITKGIDRQMRDLLVTSAIQTYTQEC